MTWERDEQDCEHDWLSPHEARWGDRILAVHKVCCLCGREEALEGDELDAYLKAVAR